MLAVLETWTAVLVMINSPGIAEETGFEFGLFVTLPRSTAERHKGQLKSKIWSSLGWVRVRESSFQGTGICQVKCLCVNSESFQGCKKKYRESLGSFWKVGYQTSLRRVPFREAGRADQRAAQAAAGSLGSIGGTSHSRAETMETATIFSIEGQAGKNENEE